MMKKYSFFNSNFCLVDWLVLCMRLWTLAVNQWKQNKNLFIIWDTVHLIVKAN